MKCNNCGSEQQNDASFCESCGSSLTSQQNAPQQNFNAPPQGNYYQPQGGQNYNVPGGWGQPQGGPPSYPPPQYMPPPPGYPGNNTNSGSAIAALVFGILSTFCGVVFLFQIFAIVLGAVGIKEQKRRGLSAVMPIVGLVLGICCLVFWGLSWYLAWPTIVSEMP